VNTFPLSILLGVIGPWQLVLFVVFPLGLVGLCALGFARFSKTKQARWAVLGAISGVLFLLMVIAAFMIVNEMSGRQ